MDDAKTFFTKLDECGKVRDKCCQFCSSEVTKSGETPPHTLEIFESLYRGRENHKKRVKKEAKCCRHCVQLLNRVKMVKSCYKAKERYLEKQQRKSENVQKPPKKRRNYKKKSVGMNSDDENFVSHNVILHRSASRLLQIRAKPKYVAPDPEEPVDSDYQCHMSDFEEVESDNEVPPVMFRFPLNVPFKHKFFSCPDCTQKFVNPYEMEMHYEIQHATKSPTCDLCEKTFKDVKTVRDHKNSVHTSEFSAFNFRKMCDICGVLTRKFDAHYAIHFDARPFKCQHCTADYKIKPLLDEHIRTVHMGEKRHKCQYCDKRFSYGADKMRHEIGVHTKAFKHICHVCGKCFLKKNFMTAHQKSLHPEIFEGES